MAPGTVSRSAAAERPCPFSPAPTLPAPRAVAVCSCTHWHFRHSLPRRDWWACPRCRPPTAPTSAPDGAAGVSLFRPAPSRLPLPAPRPASVAAEMLPAPPPPAPKETAAALSRALVAVALIDHPYLSSCNPQLGPGHGSTGGQPPPAPPHASQRLVVHHTTREDLLQSAASAAAVLVDAATSASQPALAVALLCPPPPSEPTSSALQPASEPATSPDSPPPSLDCPEPCFPEARSWTAKGDTSLFRSRGTARQLTAGAARLRTLKLSDFLENNIIMNKFTSYTIRVVSVNLKL
ncbi:uncharacterized protein [Agelaius tricolor]|uniref:uncharacterized protein n=1 Tax=Agelaius tricolor TaxID=9191 RepID=UPI0039F206C1